MGNKKEKLKKWAKEHKGTILTIGAGVAVTALTAAAVVYNKDKLQVWLDSIREEAEKEYRRSPEWIKTASDAELHAERANIQELYRCASGIEESQSLRNVLNRFDREISIRDWAGQTPVGPAYHREHGTNLYKPD